MHLFASMFLHMLPCDLCVRSELHLGEFQRVEKAFPMVPNYTVSPNLLLDCTTLIVLAIQLAFVAFVEPPGTFVAQRTVTSIATVAPVFSAELHTNMITHGIT